MSSEFPIVSSTVDVSSEQFIKFTEEWNQVLKEHEKAVKWCISEGQAKYVTRHMERGMLLGTFRSII